MSTDLLLPSLQRRFLAQDIPCAWSVITPPTQEPLSLVDAKQQARITDDASNTLLLSYIKVAREAAEDRLGRGLLTQTIKLTLDGWARVIPLPMAAPLQSITSVKYYDTDGNQQTLATSVYDLDVMSRPGRVVLKPSQTWPPLQAMRMNGRVEIVYIVGWTDPILVPEQIRQGMRMYVTYLDLDRDGMEPQAQQAEAAALNMWSDQVRWTPPQWGW